MINRYMKIVIIISSFMFTTGFLSVIAFIGPATTVLTSGNVYKASAQFIIDQGIKKKTGKNSLTIVKDEIEEKQSERNFKKELRLLVEKRIKITRQKLDLQKINQ